MPPGGFRTPAATLNKRVTFESFSMSLVQQARLSALTVLGRHPTLFHLVAGFGSGRQTLVTETTGLCIEAPPRCGNSFFVTGFSMANPQVELAHHHHVPAQVMRATSLRVPVVTLLRNPIDSALAKAAPGNQPFLIGTTLRRWIVFWDVVQGLASQIPVVPFEYLIEDPAGVITRINQQFGASFSTDFPDTARVFAEMERSRLSNLGAQAAAKPNPNIPHESIAETEARLRPGAQRHPLSDQALRTYRELLARVSPSWPLAESN